MAFNNPYKQIDFNQFIQQFDPSFIEMMNMRQQAIDEKCFMELKAALEKSECSICGHSLKHIDEEHPCYHWLINSDVKKKKYKKLFERGFGLIKMYGYLTWVANTEKILTNIDDTNIGNEPNKIFETTIRYKNFEWTFSLAKTDLEGHEGTESNFPHFHLQMKKDGNIFIKFNDFHIPLSQNDFQMIEMKKQGILEYVPSFETGIKVLDSLKPEEFNNLISRSSSDENASFRTQTFLLIPNEKEREIKNKIIELRTYTDMTVPQIADYLNTRFGYGIQYQTRSLLIDPVIKNHRK